MLRRRIGSRWVLPMAAATATALLSLALVGPAHAAVGGTSLAATKTMSSDLANTYGWTLSKTAVPTTLTLDAGESGSVEYTVGATKSPSAQQSATFSGEICVTNTGSVATQGLQIVDRVSKLPKKSVIASTIVDVSAHPVLAPAEQWCYPYRIDLGPGAVVPGATYKDTAAVTITNKSGRGSGPSPSATTVLPMSASTPDNDEITVVDTNGSTFTFSASGTRTYAQSFECDADAGTHTNTVSTQGFVSTATVSTPAPASATVTVACPTSDVTVVKTADDATVDAGSAVGFTMTVTNMGSGTATEASLSDSLPAGVDWAIDSQSWSSCSITGPVGDQTLSCDFGSLAAQAATEVHVTAATGPGACGTLVNTATVSASNEPSSAGGNNSSSASIGITCPDVAVVKTADASTVITGGMVGFTMTVTNLGPGTATGAMLFDSLPGAIDWSVGDPSGIGCSINGPVSAEQLVCNVGTLPMGAQVTVRVLGVAGQGVCGALLNTVVASATNESSSALANNSSTATATVQCVG